MPEKKCWDKNRRKKLRKNFFYIHRNIVTKKLGGKKRETIFPETQQIVRAKNVRKKINAKKCEIVRAKNVRKKTPQNCEKTFLIFTRIS